MAAIERAIRQRAVLERAIASCSEDRMSTLAQRRRLDAEIRDLDHEFDALMPTIVDGRAPTF